LWYGIDSLLGGRFFGVAREMTRLMKSLPGFAATAVLSWPIGLMLRAEFRGTRYYVA